MNEEVKRIREKTRIVVNINNPVEGWIWIVVSVRTTLTVDCFVLVANLNNVCFVCWSVIVFVLFSDGCKPTK